MLLLTVISALSKYISLFGLLIFFVNKCFISPAHLHSFRLAQQILSDGKTPVVFGITLDKAIELIGLI